METVGSQSWIDEYLNFQHFKMTQNERKRIRTRVKVKLTGRDHYGDYDMPSVLFEFLFDDV